MEVKQIKFNELKLGDKLKPDSSRGCLDPNAVYEVVQDPYGVFCVNCKIGRHYFGYGHLDVHGMLTGFYLVQPDVRKEEHTL